MKILFITELYPKANKGGEYIRNYGLYKLLENSKHEVISILGNKVLTEMPEIIDKEKTELFDFSCHYKYESLLKDVFLKFKKQPDLISLLDKICGTFKPDVVFWDYYYYGQYISYFKKKGIPVVYGTHNVQSRLTLQEPAKKLREKLARLIIFLFMRLHELFYFKKADAIIAVSTHDYNFYSKRFPSVKSYVIPNFLIEDDYSIPDVIKEGYIIMTGNFGAYQNKQGLKWFLDNVWHEDLLLKTKLVVAGRSSDVVFRELSMNNSYKNVEAVGGIEDMKPYIAKAKLSIVPLLHGSGTRLKCIESMALKTQLISTSQGAEGIEHNGSILIANNPESFKKMIMDVLENKLDKTQEAYNIFISKYSLTSSTKMLNQIIDNLFVS
ncbi:MAG: glycosyltransferase family 4 protein [Bacteroidales bacterium]|nr:glycosyltransferase family 4 protein [Bacteroidales bacterium]